MLRRTVARSLARSLLLCALAQTALGGCSSRSAQAPAGRRESPVAVPTGGSATGSGSAANAVDVGGSGSAASTPTPTPTPTSSIVSQTAATADTNAPAKPALAPTVPMPPPPPGTIVPLAHAQRAQGVVGDLGGASGIGAGYGVGYGRMGATSGTRGNYALAAHDPVSTESYKDYGTNAWTDTAKDHLSTFAADVDTASYTIARRKLTEGALPPTAAVRVEEFVNYFHYGYAPPADGQPFAVHIDAAPSPFNSGREIVRVGVTTKAKSIAERKPMRLVFLVDVSGSMQSPDKLELAKRSLRILVDNLKDGDTVALVTYAGATRLVLPATGLEHKAEIEAAIEELTAGGSTAMASGIDLAYQQAMKGLGSGVESRVIVLSDGDANVGNTSHEEILATISSKVKEGVTLSTIGFGMGNYKDETMEQLADKGNGNSFYIDGLSQAKRVFQQQLGSTLEVVAQDVKLQVDFDPAMVSRYRLIGYENRDVADADFRNDAVDAGEIGAGHQVTALYEVELHRAIAADKTPSDSLLTVRVRAKQPKGTKASEQAFSFASGAIAPSFAAGSDDLRFAFAVAAFADVLRGSEDAEHWDLAQIQTIAKDAAAGDPDRKELVGLIQRARDLKGGVRTASATIAQ
ncbi:MAG TPA: VWA domain-containing protein [Kofleriaceae bacterium]|nr:VWA domain-containing protein [Kofleriaceae bacterium]